MKLPLAYSLKNRASSLAEDAKLLNGYVESRGDPKKGGLTTVEKRPALDSAFELSSGTGQALYVTNIPNVDGSQSDVLGVVISDILTRGATSKTKRLRFGVQPSAVALNTAISPAVTVTIRDSLGAIVNSSANVTIALSNNPTGATLGGTLTVAAVAGTATFNNLTLDRSGSDFTLVATSTGLNSATSDPFTIATHLVFSTQPVSTTPGTTFSVTVQAQDTASAVDTRYTGFVTLEIYGATSASAVTLGGNLLRQAVAGEVTFPDLVINQEATSVTLKATAAADSGQDCYTPSLAISASFNVLDATHSLVAVDIGPGDSIGFSDGLGGSITPSTMLGVSILVLQSNTGESPTGDTLLIVNGSFTQSAFTSLTMNGVTLLTADADGFLQGPTTRWRWSSPANVLTAAGTYPVTIV